MLVARRNHDSRARLDQRGVDIVGAFKRVHAAAVVMRDRDQRLSALDDVMSSCECRRRNTGHREGGEHAEGNP